MSERNRKFAGRLLLGFLVALAPIAAPAAGFEVAGQVLDDGVPVAGAEIALHLRPSPERAGRSTALAPALATVKPSSEGDFSLPIPASDPAADYVLVARAPGRVAVELPVTADESTYLRAPIGLPRDAGCRVRLIDERGQPIAKATWVAEFVVPFWNANYGRAMGAPRAAEGETDTTGAFAFACPAGQGFELSVFASGYAPIHIESSLPTTTLKLHHAVERPVRFVDAGGQTVADVSVFCCRGALEQDGRLLVAKANARGVASLRASTPLALTALAPDGRFANFQFDPAPVGATVVRAAKPRDIVLSRTWQVAGRVVEARTGRPIEGARVGQWSIRGHSASAKTGPDGSFRLESRVERPEVSAAAVSYLPVPPRQVQTGAPVTFELVPARRVAGLAVDEAGRPLPEVEWKLGRKEYDGGPLVRTRGGRDGRFELNGLDPAEQYVVRASKRGYGGGEFDVPSPEKLGPDPWRVTLRRGGDLRGVAVDASDRPISGARVTWSHTPRQGGGSFVRPRPQEASDLSITDAKGAFGGAGIEPGPHRVSIRAPGFAPLSVPNVELASGETSDLGRVVLEGGLAIRGRVVDGADQPLQGVVVEMGRERFSGATGEPSTTDAAGAFSVVDLAKGSRVTLSFSLTGYAERDVEGIEVKPDAPPMRVVLSRSLTVSGRVVDEEKRPVAGARVTTGEADGPEWQPRELQPGATTDFEGRFAIAGVKPGGGFLIATAEGFQETRLSGLELSPGQDLEGIEVVLARGASIAVRVLDEEGKPVAEATVVAARQASGIQSYESSITDPEGRVVIRGVPTGPHTMRASHRGRQASTPLDVRAGENVVEVRFLPAHAVRGSVVDVEGKPVAEAQIRLRALTGESSGGGRATTDAAGVFETDPVPDGAYRAYVSHPAHLRFESKEPIVVAGGPVEGVQVVLQNGGRIRGHILGLERAELALVQVYLRSATPSMARGVVNADGSYTVAAAPLGPLKVEGRVGERTASTPVTVEAGTVAEADLQFSEGLVLRGKVRRAGEPVPGFGIEARGLGFSSFGTATTDLEGSFSVEGLTAGRHRVAVSNRQYREAAVREVEVGERGADVEIELTGAFVGGQVVDAAENTAIVGAEVSLVSTVDLDESGREWEGTSDSRGIFVFHDVPDGDYRLVAVKEGYSGVPLLLTLAPGERKEGLTIELESADTLSITLSSSLGAPSSISYAVFDSAGVKLADGWRTVEGGQLKIASLGPGSFSLLLSAAGFAVVDLPVSVPSPPLQVGLEREATLQVRAPGAEELSDVTARFVRSDGRVFRRRAFAGSGAESSFYLRQGVARISGLPSGSWTVIIERDGAALGRSQVQLTPGSEAPVVVEVQTP